MMMGMPGVVPVLLVLVYVGILIYMFSLATRFVRAVEKIADKFNQRPSEETS